jgi:hypothetical protein
MAAIVSRFPIAALAVCASLAAAEAGAATTPIYKCFDRDQSVLYTDQPCKGEVVHVRAGQADPAALARLDRERDALSQAIDRRLAYDQRIRLAREYPPPSYLPPSYAAADYGVEVTYPAYAPWPYYGYGYGAPFFSQRDMGRMKPPGHRDNFNRQHAVPAAPRNPGRAR